MKSIILKFCFVCIFLHLFSTELFAQFKTDRPVTAFFVQDEYFNKKYGIKDSFDDRVLLPALYDNILEFKDGLFLVALNKKAGIVDTNNKVIIPIKYDYVSIPYNGRMIVGVNDKCYLSDLTGKAVSQTKYFDMDDLRNGYYITYKIIEENHKLQGLIDRNGKTILPIKYQDITVTGSKIIAATQIFEIRPKQTATANVNPNTEDKYYELPEQRMLLFNTTGAKVYESRDNTSDFFILESGVLVKKKWIKNCVFSDLTAEVIMPNRSISISYDECISAWDRDFWFVIKDNRTGKLGLMDFNGKITLKPIYRDITDFDENKGFATVIYDDDNSFNVDVNGKRIN